MHGSGDAQIVLSDGELYILIIIAIKNLEWDDDGLSIQHTLPSNEYFQIPISWFNEQKIDDIDSSAVLNLIEKCFEKNNDFALFIENLSALHRRRVKYNRILSTQPLPTMDQVGPRVLLEYGECSTNLLANWMLWRKWFYDIDNRSAQETGYLFEPLLASCLGGAPIGARNSPIKRLNEKGETTSKGRQIDCLVPDTNSAYELKLRVTIAASGQGRFGEELSFPVEARAAGFTPVLLVLDPTPSPRLTELAAKFIEQNGIFLQGDNAWSHMENEAGKVVSVFIEKYIKPAIEAIEQVEISHPEQLSLCWKDKEIEIKSSTDTYSIPRKK